MLIMAVYGSFPCGVAASLSPNGENGDVQDCEYFPSGGAQAEVEETPSLILTLLSFQSIMVTII